MVSGSPSLSMCVHSDGAHVLPFHRLVVKVDHFGMTAFQSRDCNKHQASSWTSSAAAGAAALFSFFSENIPAISRQSERSFCIERLDSFSEFDLNGDCELLQRVSLQGPFSLTPAEIPCTWCGIISRLGQSAVSTDQLEWPRQLTLKWRVNHGIGLRLQTRRWKFPVVLCLCRMGRAKSPSTPPSSVHSSV